jgi:hypothetical protein
MDRVAAQRRRAGTGGDKGPADGSVRPDRMDHGPDLLKEADVPDWEGRYEAAIYEPHRMTVPKEDRGTSPMLDELVITDVKGTVYHRGIILPRRPVGFGVRHFDRGRDQPGLAELRLMLRLEPQSGVTPTAADAVRQQVLRGVKTLLNDPGHIAGHDQLRFSINFVDDSSAADAIIPLHPGGGQDASNIWYERTDGVDDGGNLYQEKVRTHEILHLFGLFDEYPAQHLYSGRATAYSVPRAGRDFAAGLRADSIMNRPEPSISQGLTDRHKAFFAHAIRVAKMDSGHDDPWPRDRWS